jgi:hypothetical protein
MAVSPNGAPADRHSLLKSKLHRLTIRLRDTDAEEVAGPGRARRKDQ